MIESRASVKTVNAAKNSAPQPKPRAIHSCNFRYAGRLSNENARTLTTQHEKFALNVTTALELYLGATLRLKLQSLEQMAIADYIGAIASNNYLLPCALNVMESNLLMEMDIALVYPIIDLLLGGAGTASDKARELTELDEEIMQSVTAIIVRQIERAWQTLNLSLTPSRCIKPAMIQQVFMMNEKLVLLMFEMTVGDTTGPFNIVLPTSFVGFLLRHLNAAKSKKMSSLRIFQSPSLRERILDCDFVVAADIKHMRVQVKDLIGLKPGTILKMRAPVKRAGRLTVEDVGIFEALPVRNGTRKAAQLTSRLQEPDPAKE
jgi:flagellar motor switch protein FliM